IVAFQYFFTCLIGSIVQSPTQKRATIVQSVYHMMGFQVVYLFAVYFIKNSYVDGTLALSIGVVTILAGITTTILSYGLKPFFENILNVLTADRLIMLANPSQPLLRRLLSEAPGTYHHSIMVANLAEASCEAIGANGLLARTACYYHDVGKIVRPICFVENQPTNVNPHKELTPHISKNIIAAHVTDGVRILKEQGLPDEIVAICAQHHGTSLIRYFYVEAKKAYDNVEEADFRYNGPKPQTVEAAITMIADSVEAAVRAMKEPTKEKVASLVHKIILEKLTDRQFDDCDLTLQQLHIVEKTLIEALAGSFHERIEYPAMVEEGVSKAT
ncbi:MAG: HDIG domain-containing metalloprotein, partial [Bacilli bacterium]